MKCTFVMISGLVVALAATAAFSTDGATGATPPGSSGKGTGMHSRGATSRPSGEGKAGAFRRHGRGGILAALNLTDDQKAKIKEIMQTARAEARKSNDFAGKFAAYKAAVDMISTQVLTDEQRTKLKEIQAKFQERRKAMREQMKQRGGGQGGGFGHRHPTSAPATAA